jgi:hypothetical protein
LPRLDVGGSRSAVSLRHVAATIQLLAPSSGQLAKRV